MTDSSTRHARRIGALGAALLLVPFAASQAQQLTGDATRGKSLYTDQYKCYACHGFDAQTGERRLLPMNYPQEGFITFVQNSPLPNMPAYPDMPAQALADVYAYILSIPVDAPELESIPVLQELRDRKLQALEGN